MPPPKRKQTPEENARQKAAIEARQEAVAQIIGENQERFDQLHGDLRVARGLPRNPGAVRVSREQLEARIKRAEEQMAKWRQELEAQS